MQSAPSLGIILDKECFRGTAVAVIFNSIGQVAVGKRLHYSNRPLCWELPQGAVEFGGETPSQAALREAGEEFGLTPEYLEPIAALSHHPRYYFSDPNSKYHGNLLACQAFFALPNCVFNLRSGLNGEPPEFSEYKWSDLRSLSEEGPRHKASAYQVIAEAFLPIVQVFKATAAEILCSPGQRVTIVNSLSSIFDTTRKGDLISVAPHFPGSHYSSRDPYFLASRR